MQKKLYWGRDIFPTFLGDTMANPERHRMVYHVIEDILTHLKSQDDESANNFRNVLFVTYDININDIERAKDEMSKLISTFENQMY